MAAGPGVSAFHVAIGERLPVPGRWLVLNGDDSAHSAESLLRV